MPRESGGIAVLLTRILERILPAKWIKRYELFIYSAGIEFLAIEYLIISILLSIIFAAVVLILSNTFYALVTLVAVFVGMAFAYPYWRVSKRIEEMEKHLPDAFFYLASSLRAGISFSEALEDLTTAKFGALTDEFKRVVGEIRKGRSTVEALKVMAVRNRKSPVVYRSLMIIIEALERGAPMSDVLVYVANDVREILRIKQERKASTGMQMMFFIITSGFVGPAIIGTVGKLMGIMVQGPAKAQIPTVLNILLGFVVIQAIVSGLGIGVIREGKFSAGIKYGIMLAIMGALVFQGMKYVNLSF
ncbi:type II secretion system F family protein [Thermococcus gammatolerans]|uniref:Bacterial type II secretion system protein F n=1 Tax=Thermococcus gammatolerans (strain DSM 15229 / JCM 11827 / EJ3) TaxID=593117 RepID=C5A385_THEGJ|nr:type II secretion system F family protein [Thermococcus gammatolerans]ACS32697.1 Bacterial type II secretion system protein F [Thermococcus gammatolerans EJ3]